MNEPTPFAPYAAAQELETFLGNPEDTASLFSYARAIELDEHEEAPGEACGLLDEWGLNLYYVPEADGGRLRSFEQALALGRVVSRRDLSAMIEYATTFLGYVFVWMAASPELRQQALAVIRRRGRISLGLTEKDHGGDLASCDCRADLAGDHYLLSGEKWLINNATRGEAISCLARTDPGGGPRGFSFFFVQKPQLPPGTFELLPKVRTHGIRGVDISGIRFQRAPVEAAALIGKPGMGIEIALKGLQVTRTMCANLSLGAADTALRMTVDFALNRRIYGSSVWDIPAARAALTDVFLDLLICDCVSTAATRALHVIPEQMSMVSAIVKYYVPVTLERAVQSLAVVLGARYYLREEHWHGMFQKIFRDIGIVALFDGSTAVNLNIISSQLLLACGHELQTGPEVESRLRQVFDLTAPLPQFEPGSLNLFNNGKHDTVQVIGQLDRFLNQVSDVPAAILDDLRRQVADLNAEYESFRRTVTSNPAAVLHSRGQTAALFDYARRYCIFHAASACALLWTESRDAIGGFFARGEWLQLAMRRLLGTIRPTWQTTPSPTADVLCEELRERFLRGMMFSVVPFSLSREPQAHVR